MSLSSFVSQFFPDHLARQLRELYLAQTIGNLAVSAVMIFEPIFLYRLGYTITQIVFFYLAVYILYFFLMPLGAKASLKYGYEQCMVVSSLFLVGYYGTLIGVQTSSLFLPLAVLAYAAQKTLYWPSYHYDFARFGQDREEGREVSNREVLDIILQSIGPLLGGLILFLSNFSTLFVVAGLLILLSNLPMILTRESFVAEPFSYSDCYRRLVNPEKRRVVLSFLGYGEEFVALALWPLFLSIFFVTDLFELGSLVALTTFLTVLVILYVGKITDHSNKRGVLRSAATLYAFVWVMRLTITGILGAFTTDAMSRLTKRILAVPQMTILYERARHRQHAMATAVLFEMSLVLGKIIAMLLALALLWFLGANAWPALFLMAAAFTLLYLVL